MAASPSIRIFYLSAVSVVLAVSAWIVPRFIPNPEGGFASASSAILALLILLAASLLFSLYLLVITIRNFREISTLARILGIGPGLMLAVTLAGLVIFLRF